uniref:Secreted protein n=1 Tax=Panagrellus redivivus TaxID=6233 RepID=A0A7E4UQ49_PANRE
MSQVQQFQPSLRTVVVVFHESAALLSNQASVMASLDRLRRTADYGCVKSSHRRNGRFDVFTSSCRLIVSNVLLMFCVSSSLPISERTPSSGI